MLEQVPPALAALAEMCSCHEPLLRDLSMYKRQLFFAQLYGDKITTCPAAGMLMPELVAGKLDSVLADAYKSLLA